MADTGMEIANELGVHMRAFITGNGYKVDDIHLPDEIVIGAAGHAKTLVAGDRAAWIADYMAFDTINYNSTARESAADFGIGY